MRSLRMEAGGARALRRCACALLLLWLAAAPAPARAESDLDGEGLSSSKFLMGSRYGRSPARMLSPRNDRFFMGPRYGKRSQPERLAAPPLPAALSSLAAPGRAWLCELAPAPRHYRCAPAPPRCRIPDLSLRPSED